MLALLATTGLVLLYLVIGGIGMLVIWASVVTVFMQDSAMLCALRAGVFVALRIRRFDSFDWLHINANPERQLLDWSFYPNCVRSYKLKLDAILLYNL
jgi:hypothetical protein